MLKHTTARTTRVKIAGNGTLNCFKAKNQIKVLLGNNEKPKNLKGEKLFFKLNVYIHIKSSPCKVFYILELWNFALFSTEINSKMQNL